MVTKKVLKSNNFNETITPEIYLFLIVNFGFLLSIVIKYDIKTFVYALVGITYLFYLIKNINKTQINKTYFFFYLGYLLILFVYGVISNNFKSYIYADLFSFGAIIFMFISGKFNRLYFFTRVLPKIGVIVNVTILFFVIIYLIFYNTTIASIEGGRGLDDVTGKIMSPKQLMYGSLLLYPLSIYAEKRRDKFIYDISMVLFIFFSLAMASRGSTVVAILIFALTIFERRGVSLNFKSILSFKTFKIIVIMILALIIVYQIPKIGSAIDYLSFRFTSNEKSIGADRTEETEAILSHLSFNQLIFGKGLGSSNIYWIFENVENGVNNVHYGWMFLILKGGIAFLIFVYGKVLLSITKLWNSKYLKPYCFILLAFIFLEFSHTMFTSFYLISFVFIALGAADVRVIKNNN